MILTLRQHGTTPDNADAIYCKDVLLPFLVAFRTYLTSLGHRASDKIRTGRGDS